MAGVARTMPVEVNKRSLQNVRRVTGCEPSVSDWFMIVPFRATGPDGTRQEGKRNVRAGATCANLLGKRGQDESRLRKVHQFEGETTQRRQTRADLLLAHALLD